MCERTEEVRDLCLLEERLHEKRNGKKDPDLVYFESTLDLFVVTVLVVTDTLPDPTFLLGPIIHIFVGQSVVPN